MITLDREEASFLAARLRRLFAHFNYQLDEQCQEDAYLIYTSGARIGGLLLLLESNRDARAMTYCNCPTVEFCKAQKRCARAK